jgi:hypothetical protein
MDPDTELVLTFPNLRKVCMQALEACGLKPDV